MELNGVSQGRPNQAEEDSAMGINSGLAVPKKGNTKL